MGRTYLKARLCEKEFVLPLTNTQSILSHAAVAKVPFAPAGVCGILFDNGNALSVLKMIGDIEQIPSLQIIYREGSRTVAYTADSVDGFAEISEEELASILAQNGESEQKSDVLWL